MALQPGDSRRVLFYTRDVSGALTDATTLRMYLRNALGVWTTYNYPATLLTKIDTGTYQLVVYIPTRQHPPDNGATKARLLTQAATR